MVDTCVLCESSRNLVAIWAKDLPDGAVEHVVHQVDLPARTKQLFCLRLLLRQHKGQDQSDKNAGLHGFCLPGIRCLSRFCYATPRSQSESGISSLAASVLYPLSTQGAISHIKSCIIIISATPDQDKVLEAGILLQLYKTTLHFILLCATLN